MIDLNIIVDKLLDMKPDPIPRFILLKEFRKISPDSREYQDAYDRVCSHPFVKAIENEQNERGFWQPFHGRSEAKAQHEHFGFITRSTIPAFGYYNLLLLAPTDRAGFISDAVDEALVDHCMNHIDQVYYVYNCGLSDFVPIGTRRRDSRDFCHWVRALALVSQFRGWKKYRERYTEWILSQRNSEGLWELPKKPDRYDFPLSDSWRARENRVIDSTIMVLRFLDNSKAF